jgi:hypothetical protein
MGGFWRLYVSCATVVFTGQLVLVVLLVFGTVSAGSWTPPFLASVSVHANTPTPTPDPRLAGSLAQKAQVPPTPGARFALEVEQAELNALLAQQKIDAPVKNPAVALQPGRAVLTATTTDPVGAPLEASGTLVAVEGRLRLVLGSAKAAGISLPGAVTTLIETGANDTLSQFTAQRNVYVESVEILQGKLRLTGRTLSGP